MPKHHDTEPEPKSASPEPKPATTAAPTALLPAAPPHEGPSFGDKALTVGVVAAAAALIEVELIPGMLLGVAAMLVPGLVPKIGKGLRPLVKEAVRAGYGLTAKARESMAEAGEQFQDIVAEVKAEEHGSANLSSNGHSAAAIS